MSALVARCYRLRAHMDAVVCLLEVAHSLELHGKHMLGLFAHKRVSPSSEKSAPALLCIVSSNHVTLGNQERASHLVESCRFLFDGQNLGENMAKDTTVAAVRLWNASHRCPACPYRT